jgi:hypothetical protein
MADALTIGKAAKRTGKSTSTIRRFVKSIVEVERHPDRPRIKPTPKAVQRFKANDAQFSWKIDPSLIDREFGSIRASEEGSQGGDDATLKLLQETLTTLQRELVEKNKQLDVKDQQIAKMQDHAKRQDMAMLGMQAKLGLIPSPNAPTDAKVVDVPEQPNPNDDAATSGAEAKESKKRSWFRWR